MNPGFAYLFAYPSSFVCELKEERRGLLAEFTVVNSLNSEEKKCCFVVVSCFVALVGSHIIICDMELGGFNGLLIVSLPIKKFYGKVSNLKDTKLSD